MAEWGGAQTDAELKEAYQTATMLVYPSLYEGFGLPPLEAMATYANPVASKNLVRTPMKVSVEATDSEVVVKMAMQSDAKSQKKTAENLKVAKELAPLCGGTLVEEAGSLKLTIRKGD